MQSSFYHPDNPLTDPKDDLLDRRPFATSVADTVASYNSDTSLVIGINGAWGEGKSSVLHFIKSHLEFKYKDRISVMNFNPWRYGDEDKLFIGYFYRLTALFDQMPSTSKKVGDAIQRVTEILKKIPFIGDRSEVALAHQISSFLASVETEELKDRVAQLLKEQGKQIVVLIDDVDRLERNEIQSLFRLIKLTADFPYVTYILAFDQEMVAAALSEQYGSANLENGRKFLEKIIQVSLPLPPARQGSLRRIYLNGIRGIIALYGFNFDLEDYTRFYDVYINALEYKFDTPRIIQRYLNSLRFTFIALRKDLALSEILILEAVKIVFPRLYDFVRDEYTLINRYYVLSHSESNDKRSLADKIWASYSPIVRDNLDRDDLSMYYISYTLFPYLREIFEGNSTIARRIFREDPPAVNNGVSNPSYAAYYFLVSDNYTAENMVSKIIRSNLGLKEIVELFIVFLEEGRDLDTLLYYIDDNKVRNNFSSEQEERVGLALALSKRAPHSVEFDFTITKLLGRQADTNLIVDTFEEIIKGTDNVEEIIKLYEEIWGEKQSFKFSDEVRGEIDRVHGILNRLIGQKVFYSKDTKITLNTSKFVPWIAQQWAPKEELKLRLIEVIKNSEYNASNFLKYFVKDSIDNEEINPFVGSIININNYISLEILSLIIQNHLINIKNRRDQEIRRGETPNEKLFSLYIDAYKYSLS